MVIGKFEPGDEVISPVAEPIFVSLPVVAVGCVPVFTDAVKPRREVQEALGRAARDWLQCTDESRAPSSHQPLQRMRGQLA